MYVCDMFGVFVDRLEWTPCNHAGADVVSIVRKRETAKVYIYMGERAIITNIARAKPENASYMFCF